MVPVRWVVFGDIQVHFWQETERPSRWKEMLDVFDVVFRTAKKHQADIIFLGDMFESKRSIRSDVLSATYERIAKLMRKSEARFHFIAGNHDQYAGICTQSAFKLGRKFFVHDGNTSTSISTEYGVYALPYGATPDPKLDYRVLCSHVDIRGAEMSTGILAESSGVNEAVFRRWGQRDLVLNGHYHVPQTIDMGRKYVKIECLGAPLQHNWGDARSSDIERGIYVLDIHEGGRNRLTKIPLRSFPKFYIDPKDVSCVRKGVDFVRTTPKVKVESGRKGVKAIAGVDPAAFIPAFVSSKIRDKKKQKKLIKAGFALLKGDES